MRVVLAGLIGGIVFFAWGAIAHMALPIGQMGMGQAGAGEDAVIAALHDHLGGEGVYAVPDLPPDKMGDAAAVKAYADKAKASPYAFVIYQPIGRDMTDMGGNLVVQAISDIVSAIIVAWVLSLGALGFGKRLAASTLLGLFSFLTVSVPWWNWYRFPTAFTVGSLLEQVIGWALAGAAIAWWLGRGGR